MKYLSEPVVQHPIGRTLYNLTQQNIRTDANEVFVRAEGLPGNRDLPLIGLKSPLFWMTKASRPCRTASGQDKRVRGGRRDIGPPLLYELRKRPRDIADFILNLLSSKDGSVFEHVNYGFVFTGVSRSLTHELVRHRVGFAYSQRSQRYVDESDASFVLPPALARGQRGARPGGHPAVERSRICVGQLQGACCRTRGHSPARDVFIQHGP